MKLYVMLHNYLTTSVFVVFGDFSNFVLCERDSSDTGCIVLFCR